METTCFLSFWRGANLKGCHFVHFFFCLKGPCNINQKRVDQKMTSWTLSSHTNTSTEWKVVMERQIKAEEAHGGKTNRDLSKTVSWLIFRKELKNWDDAEADCVGLGGHLFSKVNGTEEQLQAFFPLFPQKIFEKHLFT